MGSRFAESETERLRGQAPVQDGAIYVPPLALPGELDDAPAESSRLIGLHRGGSVRASPYNRQLFVELCRASDVGVALLVLGITYVVANAGRMQLGWEEFLLVRLNIPKLLQLSAFAVLWQQIFLLFGLYDREQSRSLRDEAPRLIAACTLGTATSLGFTLLSESGAFSVLVPLLAWSPIVVLTLATRYAIRKVAERSRSSASRRLLIVGSGPLAHKLYLRIADPQRSADCELVGFVDSNPSIQFADIRRRMVGELEHLDALLMHLVVDEVLVALPIKSHYAEIQRVIEACERAGVQSRYSADVFRTTIAVARPDMSDRQPGVALQVAPDDYRLIIKRMTDIVGALLGLILSAPLFVLIAIAIKVTSRGPVLFAQERYGWRKRRFRMLKFRTMVTGAEALQSELENRNEAAGPVFKIRNDPRVTRIGRFLRRTSLDELPQLWNVLRGEMSLVGPRPLPVRDVGRFCEAWLMRRFSVMPGITGLWQVSGRSDVGFDRWVALDLEYIDRWSLRLDLLILLKTVPAVLRARGAA